MASSGISDFCTQTGMINTDNTEYPAIGRFRCGPCHGPIIPPVPSITYIIPIGGIIFWTGVYTVPIVYQGGTYHICDGTAPTPNLIDRFIRGVGPLAGVVNTVGGINTSGGGLLTAAQLPDHRHLPSDPSIFPGPPPPPPPPATYDFMVDNPAPTVNFRAVDLGGGANYYVKKPNTHTQPDTGVQTVLPALDTLPAYYTLILLMRIS